MQNIAPQLYSNHLKVDSKPICKGTTAINRQCQECTNGSCIVLLFLFRKLSFWLVAITAAVAIAVATAAAALLFLFFLFLLVFLLVLLLLFLFLLLLLFWRPQR